MKLAAAILMLTLPATVHAQQVVPVVEIQPLPPACCASRCPPAPAVGCLVAPIQLPSVRLVDDELQRVQRSASRRRTAGIVLLGVGAGLGALTVLSAMMARDHQALGHGFWSSMAILNGLATAGTAIPGIALLISAGSKAEEARSLERRRSMWGAAPAAPMISWGGKF